MARYNLGQVRLHHQGKYNAATAYKNGDIVYYNGDTYVCCAASDTITGITPDNAGTNWTYLMRGISVVTTLPSVSSVEEGQMFVLIVDGQIAIS